MKRIIATLLCFTVLVASAAPRYEPDLLLTPGSAAPHDRETVCSKDYPRRSRNVSETKRTEVFNRYGVPKAERSGEVSKIDHLVPLSIGGSNELSNLWPHYYDAHPVWTVYKKSRLEIYLRKQVCRKGMPLDEAQTCIATNWTNCYQRVYRPQ